MAGDTRLDDARIGGRLDDAQVGGRLERLETLLEGLEQAQGRTGQTALEAVRTLTALYGEALARVLERASPPLVEALVEDELVGHLLVLHGIHPEPVERRAERAVARLRPVVRERGGELELTGVEDGVARFRLRTKGCGSSAATLEEAVREALLAAAPELSEARREQDRPEAAFVPLAAVLPGAGPAGAA